MAKKLSLDEIYSRIKADYDIESLLEPYKEGGTEGQPVERSSGTILDWLINKKKFSPDIAGAGLVSVLMEMKRGKQFFGDKTYGSKGRELIAYIAHRCDDFNRQRLQGEMYRTIAGARLELMDEAIFEMVRAQMPMIARWCSPGTWRWLRNRRKAKKDESA
jgi:hypothetical protein